MGKLLEVRSEDGMTELKLVSVEEEENAPVLGTCKMRCLLGNNCLGNWESAVFKPKRNFRLQFVWRQKTQLNIRLACPGSDWNFSLLLRRLTGYLISVCYITCRTRLKATDKDSCIYRTIAEPIQGFYRRMSLAAFRSRLKTTRDVLRDLYGQEHLLTRSFIDGSLKGVKSVPGDSDPLTNLSLKMVNCKFALAKMNFLGNSNSLQTMGQVIRVLPYRTQELWSRSVDDVLRCGKDHEFSVLRALLPLEARISRSWFGEFVLNSRSPRSMQTTYWNDHLDALFFNTTESFAPQTSAKKSRSAMDCTY